jgi:tetratricopeptide (TPR) repeat protein
MTSPQAKPEASDQLKRMLGYLEQDPNNIRLHFDTIDLCFNENQLDHADQVLAAANQVWFDHPGVLNRLAIAALRRNKPAQAAIELDTIVAAGQADAPVRYNLGYASYLVGDYAKARAALEPALADADKVPAIAPIYVLTLQQLGETDAAIAYAERRLASQPNDAELQGVLALLYLDNEKDMEACRRYAAAALKNNPSHPMALVTASALSLMDEQPVQALQLAEKVVKRNPQDGRAWSAAGLAQMNLLNFPAARQALENAARLMPGHIGTWHALAWVQLLQNDTAGADASFNKARDIDRNFGETQGGLAVTAFLRGEKDKSKTLMDRARRLAPKGMTVMYLKLLELQEQGDQEAVRKFLEDTLKKRPSFKGDTLFDMARRLGSSTTKQ